MKELELEVSFPGLQEVVPSSMVLQKDGQTIETAGDETDYPACRKVIPSRMVL